MLVYFCFLITSVNSIFGIDLKNKVSLSSFKCFKKMNITDVIVRAYRSYGGVDLNAVATLNNAIAAQFKPDIYMFFCRGKSNVKQVDQLTKYIPSQLYQTIWLDIEQNPKSQCSWKNYTAKENCQYVKNLVNQFKQKNLKIGIYTNMYQWISIMGSGNACDHFKDLPLWYAHYNKKSNFKGFTKFGGWIKPYMKQYQENASLCSIQVDLNWRP